MSTEDDEFRKAVEQPVPFKKGEQVAYAKFSLADNDWRAEDAEGNVLYRHGDWKDGVLKWFDDNGYKCRVKLCGRDNSHLERK